jgi:hypothetical protein
VVGARSIRQSHPFLHGRSVEARSGCGSGSGDELQSGFLDAPARMGISWWLALGVDLDLFLCCIQHFGCSCEGDAWVFLRSVSP